MATDSAIAGTNYANQEYILQPQRQMAHPKPFLLLGCSVHILRGPQSASLSTELSVGNEDSETE